MPLSNGQKQARWRAKRNAEARLAVAVLGSDLRPEGDKIEQADRETAIIRLLAGGSAWSPDFVRYLKNWKPAKVAKRRRKSKHADDLKLPSYEDLKLPSYDLKLDFPDVDLKLLSLDKTSI